MKWRSPVCARVKRPEGEKSVCVFFSFSCYVEFNTKFYFLSHFVASLGTKSIESISGLCHTFRIYINIDNDSGDFVGFIQCFTLYFPLFLSLFQTHIFSKESTHQLKEAIRLIRLWFGSCGTTATAAAVVTTIAIHSICGFVFRRWVCTYMYDSSLSFAFE